MATDQSPKPKKWKGKRVSPAVVAERRRAWMARRRYVDGAHDFAERADCTAPLFRPRNEKPCDLATVVLTGLNRGVVQDASCVDKIRTGGLRHFQRVHDFRLRSTRSGKQGATPAQDHGYHDVEIGRAHV